MQDINSLLDLTLEIEGLLRVLAQRDDDRVRAMIQQKANGLAMALESMPAAATESVMESEAMYVADDVDSDAAAADGATENLDEGFDIDSDFSVDIVEFHETAVDADEHEPEATVDNDDVQHHDEVVDDVQHHDEVVDDEQPQAEHAPEVQPESHAPETVPVASSAPRTFLTLNEKYRFVRELFNNQHGLMSEVVSKVTEMNSLAEAHDYILNELNLDEDNPVVIEFLEVITRFFNSRV